MSAQPIVRAGQEGELLWFTGSLVTFKATSAETDGAFLLLEFETSRGKTTPLHRHPNEDESFYILEGELVVLIDGREHRAQAGGFVAIPRGIPHALLVTSDTARFLTLVTPGSVAAESFFRDAGEPAPGRELPPVGELDIPRIKAAADRHGSVEILGPPPFAQAEAPAGASA